MVHQRADGQVGIKLIDFNVSQKVKDDRFQMISQAGTELFMAPEMRKNNGFNEKVDEWGVGVIMCFLLTGIIPSNGADFQDSLLTKYEQKSLEENPKVLELPHQVKDLLENLLAPRQEDRLSAASALIHPWFFD
jgi:serine/threonine protein kinase